ncbi:helix-turn-helix domain-containing protein [Mycolicibacterium llatzerense]|uniref:helix-turn-helix domain-containing protein n=1 Tax=Mycolicibacterium llatzerense TaxID=280871 RepID=UPI0021B6B2CB|nr:helix-turn-helix domain-containing protein [Mycolicibacterium llatzerense]MCT7371905.1 hypothetical protein [Mycolicibacterium llatzerense]
MSDSTVGMFSSRVFRESMASSGLSNREVADRLGLRVNMISGLRTGKNSPSLEALTRIAALFDRPIAAFLELPPADEWTLRHYRLTAGLTQSAVAKQLEMKSSSAVSKWELGKSRPPEDTVAILADLYGTTVSELSQVIDRSTGGPVEQVLALTESVQALAQSGIRAVLREPKSAKRQRTLTDIRGRILQALNILNTAMPQLDGDNLDRAKKTVGQLAQLLSETTDS